MLKKLFSNSIIYGLAPNIPKVVSIFILPILTAHLTTMDYGVAGTIAAYTLALGAFANLGFNVVLNVSFYKSRCQYKILWREIYGFLQYWMFIFAFIQGIVLFYIIPDQAIENRWLIIFLTTLNNVVFGPSSLLGIFYYQLSQRPMPIAIRSVVSGLLTLLINYITIVEYEWGYMGWYVSSFLGGFLVNSSYWYVLNYKIGLSPIYNFKWKTIVSRLKVSIPTIPHYYTKYLIATSNRLVMDRIHMPIASIGEFNLAQQFSTYMDTVNHAIERAATPMCMNAIRNGNEKEAKRVIYFFALVTLAITSFFCIWSREIFEILVKNEDLAKTYPLASVLVLSLNYRPMYIAASNIYFYHEKTIQVLYITFAAGIIALVANIIFIPIWGLWAASIITYCAFLFQGYSGFIYKTYKKYAKEKYPYIKIFLSELLVHIFCYSLIDMSLVAKILGSFTVIIVLTSFLYYNLKWKKLN